MNKILIVTVALALQSCATYAPDQYTNSNLIDEEHTVTETETPPVNENVEYFECKDGNALYWNNIIVKLAASPDEHIGAVLVAGVEHDAIYAVRGIERIWFFGDMVEGRNKPEFYISLKPNGIAHYFDFSEVKPDDDVITSRAVFECRPE
ncbi:MAG: hypothetical protein COA54_07740 [Thiotrichaceae bacterium]|nr:MAG: hypothetical protein COA54_07740 [Thiotrichaceae bacterium]